MASRITISRMLTAIAVLVFGGTVAFVAVVPRMYAVKILDVPLAPSITEAQGGSVRGVLREGVPPWRAHWTGRPPLAVIVNTVDGRVLAPAVLSRASFEINSAGTYWTRDDNLMRTRLQLEWRLPASEAFRPGNVARFETSRPRFPAHGVIVLGTVATLVLWTVAIIVPLSALPHRPSLDRIAEALTPVVALAMASLAAALRLISPLWRSGETDAGTIAAFAAATSNPAAFGADAMLSNPLHYSWYTPLYIRMVTALRTSGLETDHAFAGLAFLGVLLGVLGYARLLRVVSGRASWAFVGAVTITAFSLGYPANEQWGFGQALPRGLFAGLLPWCALLATQVARRPMLWPVLGAALGATTYVHPVSAPALVGAVGLMLVVTRRTGWLGHGLALAGFAAGTMVAAAPFAAKYVTLTGARALAAAVPLTSVPAFLTVVNPVTVIAEYVTNPVLVFRLCLCVVALWCVRRRYPSATRMVAAAGAGLVIVSVVVPLIDWWWAAQNGAMPRQIELSRALKYLDVVLMVALALVARRAHRERRVMPVLAAAFLCVYLVPLMTSATHTARAIGAATSAAHGRLSPVATDRLELLRFLVATRPEFQRLWVPFDLDFLRAYEIPLAFIWKDPWGLSVVDLPAMHEAIALDNLASGLARTGFDRAAASQLFDQSGATWLVLYRVDVLPELLTSERVRFVNDRYVVVTRPDQ